MRSHGRQKTQDTFNHAVELNTDKNQQREHQITLTLQINKLIPDIYGGGDGGSHEPSPFYFLLCTNGCANGRAIVPLPHNGSSPNH